MTDERDYDPELVTWLRAQLDDDEREAQEVLSLESDDFEYAYSWSRLSRLKATGIGGSMSLPGAPTPHGVLAEVDAKRRIIDWAIEFMEGDYAPWNETCLQLLALPYADRSGYRDEWRPVEVTE